MMWTDYIPKIKIGGKVINFICLLVLLCIAQVAEATHIVGGDITYKCLGNNIYEIDLLVRRDCENGDPDATFDNPASVAIYSKSGQLMVNLAMEGQLFIPFVTDDTLTNDIFDACGFVGSPVCVHETRYVGEVELPYLEEGYVLVYQRCCRNVSLDNVVAPLETGSSYHIELTADGQNLCNNAAAFQQWPDIYICSDEELLFDHSAIDLDGDSLVYKLCTPSTGATFDDPRPQPAFPPPYDDIVWQTGYDDNNMLGSGNPLTLDSQTGLLTARPGIVGQFLVGICVEEYRNGVKISETRRDFEYNTRVCLDPIIADFSTVGNDCTSLTVDLERSPDNNGASFLWEVNDLDGNLLFTSIDPNPTFTFPAEGFYEVILTESSDLTDCEVIKVDTIPAFLSGIIADFDFSLAECSEADGQFLMVNLSDNGSNDPSTGSPIVEWSWTVSYNDVVDEYDGQEVIVALPFNVTDVMIVLEVTSDGGCMGLIERTVSIDNLLPVVDFDFTLDSCNEDTYFINLTDQSAILNTGVSPVAWSWTIINNGVETNIDPSGPSITIEVMLGELSVESTVFFDNGCLISHVNNDILSELIPALNVTASSGLCDEGGYAIHLQGELTGGSIGADLENILWTITTPNGVIMLEGVEVVFDATMSTGFTISAVAVLDNGCQINTEEINNVEILVPSTTVLAEIIECANNNIVLSLSNQFTNFNGFDPVAYSWTVTQDGVVQIFDTETADYEVLGMGNIEIITVVSITENCTITDTLVYDPAGQMPILAYQLMVVNCPSPNSFELQLIDQDQIPSDFVITNQEWITDINGAITTYNTAPFNFSVTIIDQLIIEHNVSFENGCMLSIRDTIDIENLIPDASYDYTIVECEDENGNLVVSFTNTTELFGTTVDEVNWLYIIDGVSTTSSADPLVITVAEGTTIIITQMVAFANGCTTSGISTVLVERPSIEFFADNILACEVDSVFLVSNPNPDWTYSWTPDEGLVFIDGDMSNPYVIVDGNVSYMVTVSFGDCSVTDTVNIVTSLDEEILLLQTDMDCNDGAVVEVQNAYGFVEYAWSTNPDFDPILFMGDAVDIPPFVGNAIDYFVTVVDPTGCVSGTGMITVVNNELNLDFISPITICVGDTITYTVNSGNPLQELELMWNNDPHIIAGQNTTMPTIISLPGDSGFTLSGTVTNQFGCDSLIMVEFLAGQTIPLTFTTELEMCGELTVCFEHTSTFDGNIFWDFGDETVLSDTSSLQEVCYTYPTIGEYTVVLSSPDSLCAGTSATMLVSLRAEPIITIESDSVPYCSGETVMLSAISNNIDYIPEWLDSEMNPIGAGSDITVTPMGIDSFFVLLSDGAFCTDTAVITTLPFEFMLDLIVPGDVICSGEETMLELFANMDDELTYVWGPADCIVSGENTNMPVVLADVSKDIFVTVTNVDLDCVAEMTFPILVSQIEVEITADADFIILTEDIELSIVDPNDDWTYEWSTGETGTSIIVSPEETTTYTVTATDEFGCMATATFDLEVRSPDCDQFDVFLPTAFSPNGDGVNDVLFVRSNFVKSMRLVIYNRWGERMFYSDIQEKGWDGTHQGSELPPDAYGYVLDVVCVDDQTFSSKGNVSIIK